jgi:hypothetical protein
MNVTLNPVTAVTDTRRPPCEYPVNKRRGGGETDGGEKGDAEVPGAEAGQHKEGRDASDQADEGAPDSTGGAVCAERAEGSVSRNRLLFVRTGSGAGPFSRSGGPWPAACRFSRLRPDCPDCRAPASSAALRRP